MGKRAETILMASRTRAAYDHKGRMVSKRITENDGQDTLVSATTYLWDGWNIIRETQWPVTSGQWSVGPLATNHYLLVTDYVWGLDLNGALQGAGGVGGLLAVQRSDCAATNSAFCILHSALYLPTYDANGNISEYVTTNGEIVAHYDYSPFGETPIEAGDLAAPFTHRFSTKPWCPVTGLYEYQMRKYRPKIGRWLSRDPISDNHNSDLYSFCNNTTVDNIDLLGCTSSNSNPAGDGLTWVLDVQYVPWGSSEIRNGWANTWYRWPGEPPSIRKTKEAIITKASDCCAKIESGAAYELIIHQRLPTSDSAIGIFTTLNGWQSIVQHESKRSGYILAVFATYFARIANKGNLAMKCGVICHKEGWKEARHLLEDYLSSIEFEAYSLMDNYELKAQAAIGKENGSNYKYVIQDGKKLMDGMKAYFKYPAPRLSNDDFKTMCPLSDVSKGGE